MLVQSDNSIQRHAQARIAAATRESMQRAM
jgi:hypothetical protein